MVNNEPFFVGKDVAEILGYSNPRDALARHVDEEDKDAVGIHDAIGRQQDTILINESGKKIFLKNPIFYPLKNPISREQNFSGKGVAKQPFKNHKYRRTSQHEVPSQESISITPNPAR